VTAWVFGPEGARVDVGPDDEHPRRRAEPCQLNAVGRNGAQWEAATVRVVLASSK
jgi:hypothetical protein